MRTQLHAVIAALLFAGIVGAANPVVIIETSHGNIKVELNEEKAPVTVKNFLKYVDDKHYDGTVFHRVIATFMIQGGGFKQGFSQAKTAADVKSLEKTTRDPIKNEGGNGLLNERGTIAMARTNNPDSATAQFFINVEKNDFLNRSPNNPGYAVFGKVTEGMDVVDKIKGVKTGEVAVFENVPLQDVVIKSIKRAN